MNFVPAASALNSTYVKENDLNNLQQVTEGSAAEGEEDMIPHAVTGGGGLNLSEDSSEDEEVEEKEKRRQRRQGWLDLVRSISTKLHTTLGNRAICEMHLL